MVTPGHDAGSGTRHDASAGGGTNDAGDGTGDNTDNGATGSTSGCAMTSAPTESGLLAMVGVFGAAIAGAARRRRNRS
jgi:MYXO-CTERM domain-containing protein